MLFFYSYCFSWNELDPQMAVAGIFPWSICDVSHDVIDILVFKSLNVYPPPFLNNVKFSIYDAILLKFET